MRNRRQSNRERRRLADAVTQAAKLAGATRLPCPVQGCSYAVTSKYREEAERVLADHLVNDSRHTDGKWIDRDGRERVGLRYQKH